MAAPIANGTIPIVKAEPGVQQVVQSVVQPVVQSVVQPVVQAPVVVNGAAMQPLQAYNGRAMQDEQCKIFVGGVGKNTTDESLRAYFRKFGEIADSVIMIDRETGEPRGFAFVTFKSPESVTAVIEQCNGGVHTLDGKVIDPKPAVPQGPTQQTKLNQMKAQQMQTQGHMYKGPMQVADELKIFVGGIGIGTMEDDVKKYFETFGEVVAVDMPYHKIYNCPKGFAFVGFKSIEVVNSITKDRYHQINGKTVEVKDADEQREHLAKKRMEGYRAAANIQAQRQAQAAISAATIPGVGAYPGLTAGATQQVLIPQVVGGQTQYVAAQIPAPAATPQYVFDPATNTYYQLPTAAPQIALGAATAGLQYAAGGVQLMANPALAAAAAATSPVAQVQNVVGEATPTLAALTGAEGQLGAAYSNETSTFGPSKTHVLGAGGQGTDPQVVYSNAAANSAGVSIPSRGFHPYGR